MKNAYPTRMKDPVDVMNAEWNSDVETERFHRNLSGLVQQAPRSPSPVQHRQPPPSPIPPTFRPSDLGAAGPGPSSAAARTTSMSSFETILLTHVTKASGAIVQGIPAIAASINELVAVTSAGLRKRKARYAAALRATKNAGDEIGKEKTGGDSDEDQNSDSDGDDGDSDGDDGDGYCKTPTIPYWAEDPGLDGDSGSESVGANFIREEEEAEKRASLNDEKKKKKRDAGEGKKGVLDENPVVTGKRAKKVSEKAAAAAASKK